MENLINSLKVQNKRCCQPETPAEQRSTKQEFNSKQTHRNETTRGETMIRKATGKEVEYMQIGNKQMKTSLELIVIRELEFIL